MDELIHCLCSAECHENANEKWQKDMCFYYKQNHEDKDLCISVTIMEFSTKEPSDDIKNGELYKLKSYNKDHHLPPKDTKKWRV